MNTAYLHFMTWWPVDNAIVLRRSGKTTAHRNKGNWGCWRPANRWAIVRVIEHPLGKKQIVQRE